MTTNFINYLQSKGQILAELSNEDIYVALLPRPAWTGHRR